MKRGIFLDEVQHFLEPDALVAVAFIGLLPVVAEAALGEVVVERERGVFGIYAKWHILQEPAEEEPSANVRLTALSLLPLLLRQLFLGPAGAIEQTGKGLLSLRLGFAGLIAVGLPQRVALA